jgi:hypothetical protein
LLLKPPPNYRYAFKKGMVGTDVAALQINLPGVVVDGVFGPKTRQAVLALQRKYGLTADGIAGLMTQQQIVTTHCLGVPVKIPNGMLISLAANESGFALAAFSRHPSDAGYDLGAFQHSSGADPDPPQTFIRNSYDVKLMADETAKRFVKLFAAYRNDPHVKTDRRAWELAVLSHNWPAAAENLATIGHIYRTKPDDVPEAWIEQASGGRLHTAREWVAAYITKATVFVDWSTV